MLEQNWTAQGQLNVYGGSDKPSCNQDEHEEKEKSYLILAWACIQPQAAPDGAGTCPVCQGPIGAIRLLQGQDSRAEVAPRRRRRLHPFVVRWRQRQEQERQEQEQQEQAAPGNRRRRRLSDGDRAPSPVPRQRARRDLQQLGGNGPAQGPWVPRTRDELLSGGDNVHLLLLIPFEVEPPWPI